MQKYVGHHTKQDTLDLKQATIIIQQLYQTIQMPPDSRLNPILQESELLRKELSSEELEKHQKIKEMLIAIMNIHQLQLNQFDSSM